MKHESREEFSERLKKMKKKRDGSRKLLPLLERSGIMSSTILGNLLRKESATDEEIHFITKVCEETLIISRLLKLPSPLNMPKDLLASNKFWIVPSFFVQEERAIGDTLIQKSKREGQVEELLFHSKEIIWTKKVPKALFERFICSTQQISLTLRRCQLM